VVEDVAEWSKCGKEVANGARPRRDDGVISALTFCAKEWGR
jgi:hypothetical protein